MTWPPFLSLLLLAYGLGAIPFAYWAGKLKGIDLRTVGSGNLGATNVYRVLGLRYAVLVFVLDAVKGFIPTYLALNFFEQPWIHIVIGCMAVVGHSLSFFVKFKGGKGAATGMGVLAAISPDVFSILLVLAVTGIFLFRYVAPITIACSVLAPLLLWWFDYPIPYIGIVTLASLFIVWRHRANIVRLIRGQENKI
jgi:glycerol-3-phosphate acyltransferase PlsY